MQKPIKFNFISRDNIAVSTKLKSEIKNICFASLKHIAEDNKNIGSNSLTIVFTDDLEVKDLNNRFRGKNKPTNVLAFPSEDNKRDYLGDIIVSIETLKREAESANIEFKNHMLHLCLHGFLHLLGFDHKTDEQANIMENIEILTLAEFKITNPYTN